MNKFKIRVSLDIGGYRTVYAKNKEEALTKVYDEIDDDLPDLIFNLDVTDFCADVE